MEPDTEYSELLQRYRHYADDSPEAHQRRDDAHLALTEERELRPPLPPGHAQRFPCYGCGLGLGFGPAEGLNGHVYHPVCRERAKETG